LKRDPTPGTEKNEFRELVLGRIKTADSRFPIEKTPARAPRADSCSSCSAARRACRRRTPRRRPRSVTDEPGRPRGQRDHLALDLRSGTHAPDPRALERPSLEIEIILEPNRRTDAVQSPGLVKELRELLARKTIVNPDLIPAASAEVESAAPPPPAAPGVAENGARGGDPHRPGEGSLRVALGRFGLRSAVVWRESGDPETLVWFYLPPAKGGKRRTIQGIVRKEQGGEEVVSLTEPALGSDAFSSATPGEVLLKSCLSRPVSTREPSP
jgi:hypothetical protein